MIAPVIEVTPATALRGRRRLLGALTETYGVEFVPAGTRSGPDGELRFPGADGSVPAPSGTAAHIMIEDEAIEAVATEVHLDDSAAPRAFAGETIVDRHIPDRAAVEAGDRSGALARARDRLLWTGEGTRTVAAVAPLELGPGERLRDRFGEGRFLAVLALVEWVRSVSGAQPTSPRAAVLFDDPNLHGPTYGHIDFREVADWTRETGAHVAFATIPLDLWHANRKVVRLFAETPGLSLLMHGNNHLRHELSIDVPASTRAAWIRTALRRVERFEGRTGLTVDRVMAPPHGRCSEDMALTLRDQGIEGLCVSRPYPWPASDASKDPLVGWGPAQMAVEGFPTIPRCVLDVAAAELAFRSYLGQPLVVFGHHGDVAGGLEPLERSRIRIARLGAVRWLSLGEIARSDYTATIRGRTMDVRPYGRNLEVEVPGHVEKVRFLPPSVSEHGGGVTVAGHGAGVPWGETVTISSGTLEVALVPPVAVAGQGDGTTRRPARLPRTWNALPRRLATESRDRIQGLRTRMKSGRSGLVVARGE